MSNIKNKELLLKLMKHTDIHLNINKTALSVFFPEQCTPESNILPLLNELANDVIAADKVQNDRVSGIHASNSFMVEFAPDGEHGTKILYRVQPLVRNASYALRRSNMVVLEYKKDFSSLPSYIDEKVLMNPDYQRTGGLILVSGATGAGKTSLVYAAIIERLKRFGGYCLAIEDPTEVPNAYGAHIGIDKEGNEVRGFMAQIDASAAGGYEFAIHDGLRSIPITRNRPMVFIGEIRDGKTAAEMLRFSISGSLVFTTVHADDHDAACQRIITLAHNGGEPDAHTLLSKSLCASINQRMSSDRVIQFSSLTVNPRIKQAIATGNYSEFSSELKQQQQMKPQTTGMSSRQTVNREQGVGSIPIKN